MKNDRSYYLSNLDFVTSASQHNRDDSMWVSFHRTIGVFTPLCISTLGEAICAYPFFQVSVTMKKIFVIENESIG